MLHKIQNSKWNSWKNNDISIQTWLLAKANIDTNLMKRAVIWISSSKKLEKTNVHF